MADRSLASMTGRIYRIAPKGHRPSVPKLDLNSAKGAVQALQSPNLATRYLAWTKLNALQGAAEKELLKLWNGSDARMRARALHLLARINGRETKYVETTLNDPDPDLRITGLRIARERRLDVIPYVAKLARDPSAQVRRECALALRHNTSPEAPRLWAQLAAQHDGQDRWYLEALGIGADKQEDEFFGAWRKLAGTKWNTPAGRDLVWRVRSRQSPALLAELILDPQTSPMDRLRCFRALDFLEGSEKDAALLKMISAAAAN
jgi:hypothetical protein